MDVVGVAKDGLAAVKASSKNLVDVVIMDILMPGMNGIEATRRIKAARPETGVICLSMHANAQFVTDVLNAGASGYLLKECGPAELINAIHAVWENRAYLTPVIAEIVVQDYRTRRSDPAASESTRLTGREREILQLIAEGHSTRDIAERLCLSVKTIGTHRENLMAKLSIYSIAGLTKYAIRMGVTAVDADPLGRPHMPSPD